MKALVAIPVLIVVLVLDLITKAVAVATLAPSGFSNPVFGNWFRFALVYNPGAAFGLHLGDYSRWIFMALTCGAIVILWRLYQHTAQDDLRKVLAVRLLLGTEAGSPFHADGNGSTWTATQVVDVDGRSIRLALTKEGS